MNEKLVGFFPHVFSKRIFPCNFDYIGIFLIILFKISPSTWKTSEIFCLLLEIQFEFKFDKMWRKSKK